MTLSALKLEKPISACKGTELVLNHKIRQSSVLNTSPKTIILLHGVGSNEDEMFHFADYFPSEYLVVSVRAPFELSPSSYAWFHVQFLQDRRVINEEEAEKSRIILKQFINQVVERYNSDSSNIFLVGFSQGGIMSYSVGLSSPEKVKGIVAIGGRILDEVKAFIKPTTELKKIHVLIAHGEKDNTMPISYANQAFAYLSSLELNTQFKKYQIGHTISAEQIVDVCSWLNSKKSINNLLPR